MQQLRSLHGLRAISISLVLIAHLLEHTTHKISNTTLFFLSPIKDGELGVNVFFIISGFLITSILINEENITGKISIKNFFIRRTLRIFPAYYFLLIVYFILQLFDIVHIAPWSWFTSLTYTKYVNWWKDWLTAHAWSLSVEEHFYLTWPFIFLFLKKYRILFCKLLVVGTPLLKLICINIPATHQYYSNLNLTIFFRFDAIAIGCLFAFYKENAISIIKNKFKTFFLIAIGIILIIEYTQVTLWSGGVISQSFNALLGTTSGILCNMLVAIIILCTVFFESTIWSKFLNNSLINYIGILSYSIYLWQQFYFNKSDYWINKFPQNLVLIFISAYISHRLIEKPFLKLKEKFSGRKIEELNPAESSAKIEYRQ